MSGQTRRRSVAALITTENERLLHERVVLLVREEEEAAADGRGPGTARLMELLSARCALVAVCGWLKMKQAYDLGRRVPASTATPRRAH